MRIEEIGKTWREKLIEYVEGWPVVVTGSLFLFVLGKLHLLGGLERATIELAATSYEFFAGDRGANLTRIDELDRHAAPRIVEISGAEFEARFNERSPLSRATLRAEVLEPVFAERPAVVAIDLDLSPILAANDAERAAQLELDRFLLAQSERTTIVTVVPAPAGTVERQRIAFEWMQRMCQASPRILFAYAEVLRNEGIVTRIAPDFPSLGHVARQAAGAVTPAAAAATAQSKVASEVCDEVRSATSPPGFLDAPLRDAFVVARLAHEREAPLNLNYFERGLMRVNTTRAAQAKSAQLAGSVVFVGGNWGSDDSFLTAAGRYPGVAIHAATYYSLVRSVSELPHSVALLLEMLGGLALMMSFRLLWQRYYAAVATYRGGKKRKKELVRLLGYGLLWGGAAVAFGFVTLIVAILLSGWLLAQAIWLNVGPLLAVIFFKAQHAAEASKQAMEKSAATAEKSAQIADKVAPHTRESVSPASAGEVVVPPKPKSEKEIGFWHAAWTFKGMVLMLFVSLLLVLVGKGH